VAENVAVTVGEAVAVNVAVSGGVAVAVGETVGVSVAVSADGVMVPVAVPEAV
jgi:hypothetical protein